MTGREALAALPPLPTALVVAGETVEIAPLKVGEVPAFARAVQPIADRLSVSPDWLALLAEHGEAVIEAIAIAARRPRDWVMELDLDEAAGLADALFGVNADFFIRRLLPRLTEAAARIGRLWEMQMPGATRSSG